MIVDGIEKLYDLISAVRVAGPVVVTSGYYDPIHEGHVAYLRKAGELGAVHVAIVNGDSALWEKRKKSAFIEAERRAIIVDAIKGVMFTIIWDYPTVSGVIEKIRPEVFAKGGDRDAKENIPEWEVCARVGCQVRVSVGGAKVMSSSFLLGRWANGSD